MPVSKKLQNWIDEAEAADDADQFLKLFLAVSSRVTLRGTDLPDGAQLYLGVPEGSRLGPDRCRARHESRHGPEVSEKFGVLDTATWAERYFNRFSKLQCGITAAGATVQARGEIVHRRASMPL